MSKNNQTLQQTIKAIVLAEITRYQKETGQEFPRWRTRLVKYVDKGYFVTFTTVPDLSLNPVNEYNTPTGIYAYPLAEGKIAPFATERPYAIVFKVKPGTRLLRLDRYDLAQWTEDIAKLTAAYPAYDIKDLVERSLEESRVETWGGRLWFVTYKLSRLVSKDRESDRYSKTKDMSVSQKTNLKYTDTSHLKRNIPIEFTTDWAMLFRNVLGYQGVVDNGESIIHSAEPSQAVFWESTNLQVVELIEKKPEKWSPELQMHYKRSDAQELLTNFREQLKTGTVEDATWPSEVMFKNKTLKNVVVNNSSFTPSVFTDSTMENVKFVDTEFRVRLGSAIYKSKFINFTAVATGYVSKRSILPDLVSTCYLKNVHGEGLAQLGRVTSTTIENMSVSNFYSANNTSGCSFITCKIDGYKMTACRAKGHSIGFEVCAVNNLHLEDCLLRHITFDSCSVKNFTIKSTNLHMLDIIATTLQDVDLTGLTSVKYFVMDSTVSLENVKVTKALFDILEAPEELKSKLTVVDG